jgi:hypothetical protein
MNWTPYENDTEDYVPVEKWGQDHWSTLAYFQAIAVDHKGVIDNRKMRCNPRLHREFAHDLPMGDASRYPTRLKNGETMDKHDDWSCLEDMVAAGFITSEYRQVKQVPFGNSEARIAFTPTGFSVVSALLFFKAQGGKYADFDTFEMTKRDTP